MKVDGTPTAPAKKGEKAPVKQSPAMAMKTFLESKRASFEDLFPSKAQADRFMRILVALPILSPQILACTHESILKAAILCARDGLEPDGRHAALVPFRNSKANTLEATYEAMVHGYVRTAMETGAFKIVNGREVYENDEWDPPIYNPEPVFRHIPYDGERGELKGCYGYFVLKTGGVEIFFMSIAEGHAWAELHAQNAVKAADSLYHKDYRAWLLKTVVRRVLHFAPVTMKVIREDDDGGMRNVTPSPVFDVGAASEEPAVSVNAESAAENADTQPGLPGIPAGAPADQ